MGPRIGVLALQGAFARHRAAFAALDAETNEVRVPADLEGVDALVIPGGESTTISMMLERTGLYDPIAEHLAEGMPVFGTCAGMILLATGLADGRPDQRTFAAIDIDVRRNGYGRQIDSFDGQLPVDGLDSPFPASFIRAPVVERVGTDVTVLARLDGSPVLCRTDTVLVAAFHPELSDDRRIHQLFLEEVA